MARLRRASAPPVEGRLAEPAASAWLTVKELATLSGELVSLLASARRQRALDQYAITHGLKPQETYSRFAFQPIRPSERDEFLRTQALLAPHLPADPHAARRGEDIRARRQASLVAATREAPRGY